MLKSLPFDLPEVGIAAIDFIRWAETAAAFNEPAGAVRCVKVRTGPERAAVFDIRTGRFVPAVEYIRRIGIACV